MAIWTRKKKDAPVFGLGKYTKLAHELDHSHQNLYEYSC
jgi:hypothetical protein